ncbi:hypothetical protein JCM14469_33910 [Desulfatiferula olefinivorans]
MKNKRPVLLLLFTALVLALAGCRSLPLAAPSGFAAYEGSFPFRAVSPDGVMYRVRTEDNTPFAELTFWKTALRKHMTDSGYRVIADADLTTKTLPGYQLELAAPMGDRDFTYLITLFVDGDTLIIAEAAGDMALFKQHRSAVDAAVIALGTREDR